MTESTTEEVTDVAEIGSTEIGTTESETTGIYTTEGKSHLGEVRLLLTAQVNVLFYIENVIHLVLVVPKSRL